MLAVGLLVEVGLSADRAFFFKRHQITRRSRTIAPPRRLRIVELGLSYRVRLGSGASGPVRVIEGHWRPVGRFVPAASS